MSAENVVVTFGEIMCRLAPHGNLRLRQARELEITYAGAEASVATSITLLGGATRYVTALPRTHMAEAVMDTIRAPGIDCRYVVRSDEGRLGLYFLETGANQRPSQVLHVLHVLVLMLLMLMLMLVAGDLRSRWRHHLAAGQRRLRLGRHLQRGGT